MDDKKKPEQSKPSKLLDFLRRKLQGYGGVPADKQKDDGAKPVEKK